MLMDSSKALPVWVKATFTAHPEVPTVNLPPHSGRPPQNRNLSHSPTRIKRFLWRVLESLLRFLGVLLTIDAQRIGLWWNALWEPLLLLWDKSFEWPVARFLPPFVQVLGAIWLGLPDDRLNDLTPLFGFGKTEGRWPYETVTIMVLIILATLYGAEYGHRLQADISVAAADTGAQSAEKDAAERNRGAAVRDRGAAERNRAAAQRETGAAARDREAEKDQLELTKSLIRDRIAAIEDPAERSIYAKKFAFIFESVIES